MFLNKQNSIINNDLIDRDLNYYLNLTKDFNSSFDDFVINKVNGFNVIDESLSCEVGYKARAAEYFIRELSYKGI